MSAAAFPAETSPLPQYVTRVRQVEDGLPENIVTSVVQTRDGYLWLGAHGSLARFDGMRFTVFDGSNTPEMQSQHITCLFEAADSTLWIGHDTGEVTCYKAGIFRAVPIQNGGRGGKVFAFGEDVSGDIWFLDGAGDLARIKDDFVIGATTNAVVHLISITRNLRGGFWIQRDNKVSVLENDRLIPLRFNDGNWTTFAEAKGVLNRYIWSVTQDSQGRVRAGSWGSGVFALNGNQFKHTAALRGLSVAGTGIVGSDKSRFAPGSRNMQ